MKQIKSMKIMKQIKPKKVYALSAVAAITAAIVPTIAVTSFAKDVSNNNITNSVENGNNNFLTDISSDTSKLLNMANHELSEAKKSKENAEKAKTDNGRINAEKQTKVHLEQANNFIKGSQDSLKKDIRIFESRITKLEKEKTTFLSQGNTEKTKEIDKNIQIIKIRMNEEKIQVTESSLEVTKFVLKQQETEKKKFNKNTELLRTVSNRIVELEDKIAKGNQQLFKFNSDFAEIEKKENKVKAFEKLKSETNILKVKKKEIETNVTKYKTEIDKKTKRQKDLLITLAVLENKKGSHASPPTSNDTKGIHASPPTSSNDGSQDLIKQMKDEIASLGSDIDALKKESDALKQKLSTLKSEIKKKETAQQQQQQEIVGLKKEIADLEDRMNHDLYLSQSVQQWTQWIDANKKELEALKAKKASLEIQTKTLFAYNNSQKVLLEKQGEQLISLENEISLLKIPVSTKMLVTMKEVIDANKAMILKEEKEFKKLETQKHDLVAQLTQLEKKSKKLNINSSLYDEIKRQIKEIKVEINNLDAYKITVEVAHAQRQDIIEQKTKQLAEQSELIINLHKQLSSATDSKIAIELKKQLKQVTRELYEQDRDKSIIELKNQLLSGTIETNNKKIDIIKKEFEKTKIQNEVLIELVKQVEFYGKTIQELKKERDKLKFDLENGPSMVFKIEKTGLTLPEQETRFLYNGETYKTKAEAIEQLNLDKQVYVINNLDLKQIAEVKRYYYKNVAYLNKQTAIDAFAVDVKTNVHHYANIPAGTKVDTYAKLEKYLYKAGVAYTVNGKTFHTIDKAIDEYMGSAHLGDGSGKTYAEKLFDNSSKTYGRNHAKAGLNVKAVQGVGAKNNKVYGFGNNIIKHHDGSDNLDELFELAKKSSVAKAVHKHRVYNAPRLIDHSKEETQNLKLYKKELLSTIEDFERWQTERADHYVVYSLWIENATTQRMPSGKYWKKHDWYLSDFNTGANTTLRYEVEHATSMHDLNKMWNYLRNYTWQFRQWGDLIHTWQQNITITFDELINYHSHGMDFRFMMRRYHSTDSFNFERKFEVNGKWFNTKEKAIKYRDSLTTSHIQTDEINFEFTHDKYGYYLGGVSDDKKRGGKTKEEALYNYINARPTDKFTIDAWGLKDASGSEVKALIENYKNAVRSKHEYWTIDDPQVTRIKQKINIWKGDFKKGSSITVGGMNLEAGHKYFATFGGHEYQGTVESHEGYNWVFFDRANYKNRFAYTTWVSMKNNGFIYNWGSTNLKQSGAWRGNFTSLTEEKVTGNFTVQKYSTKAEALKALEDKKVYKAPVIWKNHLGHNSGQHDYHITNPAFKENETYEFVYADGTKVKVKTTVRNNHDSKWFIWVGGFNGEYSNHTWAVMQEENLLRINNGGSVNKTLVEIRNITLYDVKTGAIAPQHSVRGLNKATVIATGDGSGNTYTKIIESTDASKTRATSKTILGKNKTHAELLAEWKAHHTLTANGKTIAKVDYNANKFTFTDGDAKKAVVDRTVHSKNDGTEIIFGTKTGNSKNKVAFSKAEIIKVKEEIQKAAIVLKEEYLFNNIYFANKLDALTKAEDKIKLVAESKYKLDLIKEISIDIYVEFEHFKKNVKSLFFGINGHGSFAKIFVSEGAKYLNTKVPTFTYEVKKKGESAWTEVKFSPTDLSNGDMVRVIQTNDDGMIIKYEILVSGLKSKTSIKPKPALVFRTNDAVEIY